MLSVTAISTIAALVGCASVGPRSIANGRMNYNGVIQKTTNYQLFMNIIRAKNSEPTFFIDVEDVNAAVLFQATLSGSTSGIGARAGTSGGTLAGTVGQVGSTLEYQESPTIHYVPLKGKPLIDQLAKPIDLDSICNLSDSSWPLASILSFAVNYITPNYEDHFSVLDAMIKLDDYDALAIASVKSALTPTSTVSNAIVLYLEPDHVDAKNDDELKYRRKEILELWIRLLRLYMKTSPPSEEYYPLGPICHEATRTNTMSAKLANKGDFLSSLQDDVRSMTPDEVTQYLNCLPNWIEIREVPIKASCAPKGAFLAPLMRTRSALGILKASVSDFHRMIEFVPYRTYDTIRKRKMEFQPEESFYTLLKGEHQQDENPKNTDAVQESRDTDVSQMINKINASEKDSDKHLFTLYGVDHPEDVSDFPQLKMEETLAKFRRFILIIEGDTPPEQTGVRPFVSYQAIDPADGRNKWYYIDDDDRISKSNFALLLELFTIMATPSETPPVQPSINVGPAR
jgi:hypothetical protein